MNLRDSDDQKDIWTTEYIGHAAIWARGRAMLARLIALREELTPRGIRYAQLAPVAHLPNEVLLNEALEMLRVQRAPFHSSWPFPESAGVGVTLPSPARSFGPTYHLFAVTFCHWPPTKRDRIHLSNEAFLPRILGILYSNAWRLRSLRVWNVSDSALLTILPELIDAYAPSLTELSIKGNPTVVFCHNHYRTEFPFLIDNCAPSLSSLEIDHFPIHTHTIPLGWFFSLSSLRSLTLRTNDLDRLRPTNRVIPLLIGGEDLRLLLQSVNALEYLALYGPVVDCGDEENDSISAPFLRTLIIHCETPYYRYRHALLLHTPLLDHLVSLWQDDLDDEFFLEDLTQCLFRNQGEPKFPPVKRLRLHDSTAEGRLPATSFIRAFPNVEELILGEADIVDFSSALLSLVMPSPNTKSGILAPGTWPRVKTILLDGLTLKSWKRCSGPLRRWMRAGGHVDPLVITLNFGPDEIIDRWAVKQPNAYKLVVEKGIWYLY
ncbi:uncharacterized protein EDB91DRAFT_1250567 [Suillus paluster]|uniref:uncharacterized protein n=1 Tax=Suillus paluster TaxID=48578 RepID=UPI001B88537C|nr:uncharacterized protein EDB91DRAFT_1250567 [Suillus paluster]KAG1735353.1 hypothetical protein EDB91DRAFT_1250567 [Suillus paluster]